MRHFLSLSRYLRPSMVLVAVALMAATTMPARYAFSAETASRQNKLTSLTVSGAGATVSVRLDTEKPVGYRYTIYDSMDPVRVVVDMPGMDISAVPPQQSVTGGVVTEIRTSKFDLTSGVLGRVELLLSSAAPYNVSVDGNVMQISFSGAASTSPPVVESAVAAQESEAPVANDASPAEAEMAPVPPVQQYVGPAKLLTGVNVTPGAALLQTDGVIEKYKYFTLKSPSRLVVDLYGVKPSFKERVFTVGEGFDKVRIGTYPEKVRLVFDAGKRKLPANWVDSFANVIQVSWGKKKDMPAAVAAVATASPATAAATNADMTEVANPGAVTIENVEFKVDGGKSLVVLTLSAPGSVSDPVVEGDLIRFDVRKAAISRALRRVIDTTSFPSVVRQVTPYLVKDRGRQDVRFAVQVKGVVPFELQRDGKIVTLALENQGFTEPSPAAKEQIEVPVPAAAASGSESPVAGEILAATAAQDVASVPVVTSANAAASADSGRKYTGQKISLVFDNADIRNILQLIAEVSDMNIIAGDEVKGNISLRLVDVPWDQALDLILEIKGLGMLQEGNVVRIMPAKEMRALKLERLKDQAAIDDSEPTVTKIFSVRYAPVADIAGKIQTHLGKSGDTGGNSVSFDNRTRQIIVSARPSKLLDIEENILARLDVPERQVMIEARIVEASDTFSRDLGVKWGLSYSDGTNGPASPSAVNVGGGGSFLLSPTLATSGFATGITFGRLGVDTTVLDLRISALESSGNGRVVSTPRVTTLNGAEASINQGTEIPYQSTDANGNPKTEFKKAELALKVLPVINPGNTLVLDIDAKNDSQGANVSVGTGSAPAIDTKQAKTRVLVQDGETTVIGGIFIETESVGVVGVPLLRSIPLLGHLFKSTSVSKRRSELLIFITPRILD